MKYTTLLIIVFLSGCSNSNEKLQANTIPAKKTFVKKEQNTAPSNRNSHYPPVPVGMGGHMPPMGYGQPYNQYNSGIGAYGGTYVEPLGNGPLTHQNSAEDIDNQRKGRD